MQDKNIIREIQLEGIKMLHRFDEICKKHDIRYFACDGTLLGAIRHNGYIPWDDDLDIGIMREDMKKLAAVPKEEWGDMYELITSDMPDIKHDKLFPRVYIKNSRIQSGRDVKNWIDPTTGKAWNTSIMLDIFVFDRMPENKADYDKVCSDTDSASKKYTSVKLKANCKFAPNADFVKRSIKRIYGGFSRMTNKEPWKKIYEAHVNMIEKVGTGDKISCYYDSYYHDYYFDESDIFPLGEVKFEDMMIPVPKDYLKFLTKAYGPTYMEFPPEEDRYHINFIYADLGNGKKYVIDPIPGSLGAEK